MPADGGWAQRTLVRAALAASPTILGTVTARGAQRQRALQQPPAGIRCRRAVHALLTAPAAQRRPGAVEASGPCVGASVSTSPSTRGGCTVRSSDGMHRGGGATACQARRVAVRCGPRGAQCRWQPPRRADLIACSVESAAPPRVSILIRAGPWQRGGRRPPPACMRRGGCRHPRCRRRHRNAAGTAVPRGSRLNAPRLPGAAGDRAVGASRPSGTRHPCHRLSTPANTS